MITTHDFRILVIVTAGLMLLSTVGHSSEMDDRIEASAKKSYVYKTYLKDDNIKTEAENGIVTLTGTVSEENHKSLAQETVSSLPGVEKVDNQIQVQGMQPEKDTDGWIGLKVKTTLLFHRNVSAAKTQVDVKDGVVTLSGEADNQAQKDLTTEYVKDVEGVRDVKNELKITNNMTESPRETLGEKIDDASITAQVKAALLYHRSTSGIGTKVRTDDGIVTLNGRVHNAAEKDLVTKIVRDINGVKNVVNNLEI